jgi:signal transduction histidine kinase
MTTPPEVMVADTFAGGGEMGALMRAKDWAATPLGPVEDWSASLRTMVKVLLANRFPLLLWWGPDQCQLYNDPYRPVLGTKHPRSLGQPARECWSEIWSIIGPLILTPYTGGPATWDDDLFLEINRHGFVEETHFTIAYSPVPDESVPGGIGGVLATVHEITPQVLQERRVAALRDLNTRSAEAKTAVEACMVAAEAFGRHPRDIPFALLYLIDPDRKAATLAGAAGIDWGEPASPLVIDLADPTDSASAWPLASVTQTEQPRVIDDLSDRFTTVPRGPWTDPPRRALILPVPSNTQRRLAGLLVLGLSARLEFDTFYRSFCELATTQVAAAIANARAYEEERRRAEALAELDRAKTAFFSNVSHEFRTPLTLMLGPLEDLLAEGTSMLTPADRDRLAITHRNALRLLKLVNTLLDFSRMEAGRTQAAYAATELHTLTSDLAAVFRTAIERLGLSLAVDCPPLPEPIYVDRGMWEKIVLNLLSNALKFTFEGRIEVTLRSTPGGAALTVADTGTGIAQEELPHLFERFHRVQGARAHTYEGTGIGLALVAELVKLHGGTVAVESRLGVGTSFTVCLPTGTAHLPADQVIANPPPPSSGLGAAPYIEEALLWGRNVGETDGYGVETATAGPPSDPAPSGAADLILVADDNADMRDYLTRLLGRNYAIESATNGAAALAAARARIPDLVVSDVMMPELDGFGLLRALRADPNLREVPVILLSARAGVEATAEGLDVGADDYLVKPFTARELLARVRTHLALARSRREARDSIEAERDRLRQVLDALPEGVTIVDALGRLEALNRAGHDLLGLDTLGRTMPPAGDRVYLDYGLRHADGTPYLAEDLPIARSLRQGEEVHGDQELIRHAVSGRDVPLLINSAPLRDSQGTIVGAVAAFQDITPIRDLEVAREEFISSAAHDLKTPLTSIHGLAQLARLRLSRLNLDVGPVPEHLLQIEASTMKVVSLLDELLDVTQLHMGSSLNLNPRPTDLTALVRGVLADLENVTTHQLRLAETEAELTVTLDAARIERVVSNLLLNAVKYSPSGGTITITVAREEGPSGSWAVVAVQDEGMGIPEDDLSFIFDRFRRGRNVTGHIQGTGIGLASARGIVEQHGGTITAESLVGAGSRFTVRLPLSPERTVIG